jgi:hypothetical protein
MKLSSLFLIAALAAYALCGQTARAQKKPVEKIDKVEKIEKTKVKVVESVEGEERAVAVEPGVVITLCMESGRVTVRGGDRKEVRARLPKGMEIDFHRDGVNTNGPAKRLEVLVGEAADPDERGPHFDQCSGSADIELDVPRDATLFFKSDNAEFDVDTVAEAHIETNGGRIFMRRITRAIEAMSNEGDVSLEDSSGRVRLESFGGSVEATNVGKNSEGDFFKARSISNDVWLDNVSHSRVEISTISGEVMMRGPLARAGRYDLRTTSGDITLTLPVDSSFQLIAKVSEGGEIVTEFPLKYTGGVSPAGPVSSGRMIGTHGKGDTTINLVSFSGTLRLRRQ